MPPPSLLATFPERVLLWTVSVQKFPTATLPMPPPSTAELLDRVQPLTVNTPEFAMPPPSLAELPVSVQPLTVMVPWLSMPPPWLAELPDKVVLWTVAVEPGSLKMPPPPTPAKFPDRVQPVTVN